MEVQEDRVALPEDPVDQAALLEDLTDQEDLLEDQVVVGMEKMEMVG